MIISLKSGIAKDILLKYVFAYFLIMYMNYIKPTEMDSSYSAIRKINFHKKGPVRIFLLGVFALASLGAVNDYADFVGKHRGLCELGKSEEALQLVTERNLASSIIAYIEGAVNGNLAPCENTIIPESGVFEEYPTITHEAGTIPNRPEGTVAYALTITRCPEVYTSTVDGTPDPGEHIFEATAIIKDEICTLETMKGNLALGHTL